MIITGLRPKRSESQPLTGSKLACISEVTVVTPKAIAALRCSTSSEYVVI